LTEISKLGDLPLGAVALVGLTGRLGLARRVGQMQIHLSAHRAIDASRAVLVFVVVACASPENALSLPCIFERKLRVIGNYDNFYCRYLSTRKTGLRLL
jgi:hypothetical protein